MGECGTRLDGSINQANNPINSVRQVTLRGFASKRAGYRLVPVPIALMKTTRGSFVKQRWIEARRWLPRVNLSHFA
jgi:hypothetical protein